MNFMIVKEFKQLIRNSFVPRLIIIFPIMMICVIPWAVNMQIKNVNLAIVDFDKTSLTQRLVMKIAASSYFNITLQTSDKRAAYECVYQNQCDLILELANGFEQDLEARKGAGAGIYANAINSIKGTLGAAYLSSILADFAQDEMKAGLNLAAGNLKTDVAQGFESFSYHLFNPSQDYKNFMIPALMVLVLTLICGFLPAFNIVGEKEKGISEQINVTPVSKFAFIFSKLVPYWLIGLCVLSLCFLLAFIIYGLLPKGSFVLIYLFACAYILVVAGLGLVVSNYSNTMQQAMFVIYFFVLILILLSGLFTSIKSMPLWAQYLTIFNPLRYFIEALREIYLKGSHFIELYTHFLALLAFATFFNLWAIFSYKKRS